MRRAAGAVLVLAAALAGLCALQFQPPAAGAQDRPPGAPGGPPPGAGGPPRGAGAPPGFAPVPGDSFAAERDSLMREVLKQIAGRETMPAESVFKNIRTLKGVPAGRVARIMNFGYGRSLGVRCAHCHDPAKWDSDDKAQKQIARDMHAMMGRINSELLPAIRNLKSEQPGVNCTTCHRGQVKPAQNL